MIKLSRALLSQSSYLEHYCHNLSFHFWVTMKIKWTSDKYLSLLWSDQAALRTARASFWFLFSFVQIWKLFFSEKDTQSSRSLFTLSPDRYLAKKINVTQTSETCYQGHYKHDQIIQGTTVTIKLFRTLLSWSVLSFLGSHEDTVNQWQILMSLFFCVCFWPEFTYIYLVITNVSTLLSWNYIRNFYL